MGLVFIWLSVVLALVHANKDGAPDPDSCITQYPNHGAVAQDGDGGFSLSFSSPTWTVNQQITVTLGISQTGWRGLMIGAFVENPNSPGSSIGIYRGSWVSWETGLLKVVCGFASDGTEFDTDGPNAALTHIDPTYKSGTLIGVWQAPPVPDLGTIIMRCTVVVDDVTFYLISSTLPEKPPPCQFDSCGPFGTCDDFTTCACQAGYGGVTSCCPLGCSGNGVCNTTTNGTCLCNEGFVGDGCQFNCTADGVPPEASLVLTTPVLHADTCFSGTLDFSASATQFGGPGVVELSLSSPTFNVSLGTANYPPCTNATATFDWDTRLDTNASFCGQDTAEVLLVATDVCGLNNSVSANVTIHLDNRNICDDAETCSLVGQCTDNCCGHTCACPNTTCGAACEFVQTNRAPALALLAPVDGAVVSGQAVLFAVAVNATNPVGDQASSKVASVTIALLLPLPPPPPLLTLSPPGGLQVGTVNGTWNSTAWNARAQCVAVSVEVNATDQCGNTGTVFLSTLYINNNQSCSASETALCTSVDMGATCTRLCPVPDEGAAFACQCTAGFFSGAHCNVSLCSADTTCNGNGQCNFTTDTCVCNANFAPPNCGSCVTNQYNYAQQCTTFCLNTTTCSGHGQCNTTDGSCMCNAGFAGAACNSCSTSQHYFGYPQCTFCLNTTTCSGHGQCNTTDGSCVCATGFAAPACDACSANRYGFPQQCTFCLNTTTCSGHGQCNTTDGSCICNTGFTGAACNSCSTNYYGFPQCTFCLNTTTCSGHGQCDTTDGSCVCATGFAAPACDACSANRYGFPQQCTFCLNTTTCSGHGQCNMTDGSCICASQFTGSACNTCIADYYNVAQQCSVLCLANTTCTGHGQCDATTGECDCRQQYAGTTNCSQCATNYYSYPQCIFCDPQTTCSGNGRCSNMTGECVCNPGFNNTDCSLASTCGTMGGTCLNGGTCVNPAPGQFQCQCLPHCTGPFCSNCDVCVVDDEERCKNGATCVTFPGQPTLFQCQCPPLFTGITCDQPLPNLCADPLLNPCSASQTCVATDPSQNLPGSFVCVDNTNPTAGGSVSVGIEHQQSLYNHSLLPTCSATRSTACVPGSTQFSLLEHVSAVAAAGSVLLVHENLTMCWSTTEAWSHVQLQMLATTTTTDVGNCLWDAFVGFNSPPDIETDIFCIFTAANSSHRLSVTGPGHQLMTSSATEVFVLQDAGSSNSHTFNIKSRPDPDFYVTAHRNTGTVTTEAALTTSAVWAAVSVSNLTSLVRCLTNNVNLWTECV